MTYSNQVKTVFLVSTLIAFFVAIGYLIGNKSGMIIALIIGLAFNFFSYWFSDKIVLAMYQAKELPKTDKVYNFVKELSNIAKIPMPKVYIVNTQTPNAFATGRNPSNSAVAVTSGILDILTDDELKGVLAHELSHIKHRDTLIQTLVVAIVSAVSVIANMLQWALIFGGFSRDGDDTGFAEMAGSLIVIILAPIVATIIQLAISRRREFMADEGAAKIHNPISLIGALDKLEKGVHKNPFTDNSKSQTSSMFIVNPFSANSIAKLFSTHPSTKDRIKKLKEFKK